MYVAVARRRRPGNRFTRCTTCPRMLRDNEEAHARHEADVGRDVAECEEMYARDARDTVAIAVAASTWARTTIGRDHGSSR